MCSHLQRKLFDAEGEYRAIREEIERDEELTAVVRSSQGSYMYIETERKYWCWRARVHRR